MDIKTGFLVFCKTAAAGRPKPAARRGAGLRRGGLHSVCRCVNRACFTHCRLIGLPLLYYISLFRTSAAFRRGRSPTLATVTKHNCKPLQRSKLLCPAGAVFMKEIRASLRKTFLSTSCRRNPGPLAATWVDSRRPLSSLTLFTDDSRERSPALAQPVFQHRQAAAAPAATSSRLSFPLSFPERGQEKEMCRLSQRRKKRALKVFFPQQTLF